MQDFLAMPKTSKALCYSDKEVNSYLNITSTANPLVVKVLRHFREQRRWCNFVYAARLRAIPARDRRQYCKWHDAAERTSSWK